MSMLNCLQETWIKLKGLCYLTLTEENIEKLSKRKDEEFDDYEILEEQEMRQIKRELEHDLHNSGLSDEEVEKIIDEVAGGDYD